MRKKLTIVFCIIVIVILFVGPYIWLGTEAINADYNLAYIAP